jgi:polysaccharide export outer membrane protein
VLKRQKKIIKLLNMKKITLPIILCLVLILQACGSKKDMLYLQDLDNYSNSKVSYVSPNIQPNDILKVEVSDLNPLVAAPFNINSA